MPRSLPEIRAAVERALDEGDQQRALLDARESLRRGPDAEGYYLLGRAFDAAMESDSAQRAYETAVNLDPEHADAQLALAQTWLSELELDLAYRHLTYCLRAEPMHPGALYFRGCLRELQGNDEGAARDFAAAAANDPDGCPLPAVLDDTMVETVVQEVLDSLHPTLQNYLANVAILVEEMPGMEVLEQVTHAYPFELLGSFSGRSLTDSDGAGAMTTWSAIPPTIAIYRRNLQRFADGPEQLVAELRITLLHEIGHFLGLDEDDLARRGLD